MKQLFSILVFALLTFPLFAQDGIIIPLQDTTIQIRVNKLVIKPIGTPRMGLMGADSMLVQDVYYQLIRTDGVVGEQGNKTIPMQMYYNGFRYIDNTVTGGVVNTINFFFQAAGWPELKAKMPE